MGQNFNTHTAGMRVFLHGLWQMIRKNEILIIFNHFLHQLASLIVFNAGTALWHYFLRSM